MSEWKMWDGEKWVPMPIDRIASALERIADALEDANQRERRKLGYE